MGGYDDHVAIMGDWMSASLSPRSFLSSMNGDDSINENRSGSHFVGPGGNDASRINHQYGQTQPHVEGDNSNAPKMGSRAGLMERMAARAGFHGQQPKIHSPYHEWKSLARYSFRDIGEPYDLPFLPLCRMGGPRIEKHSPIDRCTKSR